MKLSTFKVPVKITRVGNDIDLEIMEDEKKLDSEKELDEKAENEIAKYAKQVSDFNETQKTMQKKMLLKSELSREGFMRMQFLT